MKETKKIKMLKNKSKIKNKKLSSFVVSNFPDFEDVQILKENKYGATIRLDYGENNPMMDIDIKLAPDNDKYAVYKLVDTRFVY